MDNIHLAKLLDETAAEDGFRIRSYRNAAKTIEGHPEFFIAEIKARGSFERRNEMLEKYPPTALSRCPSISPIAKSFSK